MENLDIILLTTVLVTLFLVFIIMVYRELKDVDENTYKTMKDGGPRVAMIKFLQGVFDSEHNKKMKPVQKVQMYNAIKRTISDMESDGVYFSKEIKEELKKRKDKMTCEYSGLPSVISYLKEEEDFHQGHS